MNGKFVMPHPTINQNDVFDLRGAIDSRLRISVVALVLLFTALTGFGTELAFDVPRLDDVSVNGDAAEWEQAFLVEHLIPAQPPLPARERFSASVRLGWNDDGLLVLVSVAGTGGSEAEKLEELWRGNSVELFLAPSPTSPDHCQWVVAPGGSEQFPSARSFLHDYRQTEELKKQPGSITVATRRTATGYQVEALLPWASLGIVPEIGREVACQITINQSKDDGGRERLVWFPMHGAYSDSRKMHRLRLSRTGSPPSVARALGRINYREGKTAFEVFANVTLAGQEVRVRTVDEVLAAGRLQSDSNGYARIDLAGRFTNRSEAFLEMREQIVDVVPLALSPTSLARACVIDTLSQLQSPAVLTLPAAAGTYKIMRRAIGEEWITLAKALPAGEFRDPGMVSGVLYEYAILRDAPEPAARFFCAGLEVPLVDHRGTIVLIVETSQATPLAAEIRRLILDLVGDGWQVVRHQVTAEQSPTEVKRLIAAQPAQSVLLLGYVPVPYSGDFRPDGHDDHIGAWPADVYYGVLDGEWTDSSVTSAHAKSAERQHNVPGDGKFDQNEIPGPVRLAVGRVDFHDLPAFGADETTLLREYLDRNHAYRQGTLAVETRGWIQDNFVGHPECFAYSGWQNLTTLLGPENVVMREWPNIEQARHLWFYGCGPGGWQSMSGFGDTADLVSTPLNAVFALMFGSYFGDWDTTNNLMRAALAGNGGALTCGWAGRPHWYLHPMGMGATIGECLRLTQNNPVNGYQPAGGFARGVHIALLGDPTLRLHRVLPPSDLRVTGRHLRWRKSPQPGVRYHVYRAETEFGSYERLTPETVDDCEFTDRDGKPGQFYMVRAVALQPTPTGSYYNASQGAFSRNQIQEDAP
jgi:hypothetical protein